jgi:hypothetical protein
MFYIFYENINLANMELGQLLTLSNLTHLEVSNDLQPLLPYSLPHILVLYRSHKWGDDSRVTAL